MARKYDLISELYDRTCKTVVSSPQNWEAFLTSACRNYKLRFDEQLLVFAQRPDATAVLEIERWNGTFGRWVNRGATGIAVFDDASRSRQRLIHYFDISDTHPSKYSRPVPIWEMKPEYEQEIIETLESTFGTLDNSQSLADAVMSAAQNAAEDNLPDYTRDLLYSVNDSFLEELDEDNISTIYRKVVTNSVAYMMMERLGIDTEEYFEREDFEDIINFNTPGTLNALGFATSDIAEMGLTEIAKTVMSLERQNRIIAENRKPDYNIGRNQNTERSPQNERADIHDAGRLQYTMSNSLASVHPELISEWSEKNLPLTPDKITFGSNKRVWWIGACGHEWETSVKARSKGEKCPICSGARVIEGINDLATLKPLLAQEWSKKNKLKPTEVSVASHKKIIWKCKHGHEWEASVKSRTVNGTGCPYCSHNKVLAGFNDLASQYPDIAAEWSDRNLPLLPTMVTAFANSKAWWKCKDCGNEWYTLISTRSGGSRCPYCSGYTLLKGFNDLATTHPDLAAEWSERNYPLMPDEVNAKSRHNVWWKCKTCGNEWKSVINARVKGTVCPVCADRAVLAGYNDLATTDRKLLAEWDYEKNSLLPTQVSRKSMKSVWWKCSLGHSWKAKISDRTIIGEKCTVCESEYRSVFPGLAVAYYANQKGLKVQLGSDKLLGIPLETYIPSEKLAIEFTNGSEHMEVLKSHLCKQRNIKLVKLPFKTTETEAEYADRVLLCNA